MPIMHLWLSSPPPLSREVKCARSKKFAQAYEALDHLCSFAVDDDGAPVFLSDFVDPQWSREVDLDAVQESEGAAWRHLEREVIFDMEMVDVDTLDDDDDDAANDVQDVEMAHFEEAPQQTTTFPRGEWVVPPSVPLSDAEGFVPQHRYDEDVDEAAAIWENLRANLSSCPPRPPAAVLSSLLVEASPLPPVADEPIVESVPWPAPAAETDPVPVAAEPA
jgi:hypothetical protein